MNSHLKIFVIFILIIMAPSSMAWNQIGHKVVAHIAYDHLTPEARRAIDRLTDEGSGYSGRSRFVYISTWADWVREHGDTRFRHWHYMDLPLSVNNWPTRPPRAENAVYGINHCRVVLKNAQASIDDQRTCLKLLVHIVGDIHQPLHGATLYSDAHPKGDHGGNSYKIKSHIAENLHMLWDRGLGEFRPFEKRKSETGLMIHLFAEGIEHRYPQKDFNQKILDLPPIEWANESRQIAENFVYEIPEYTRPSEDYVDQGRVIVNKRLALAGYRLATLLNLIYNSER